MSLKIEPMFWLLIFGVEFVWFLMEIGSRGIVKNFSCWIILELTPVLNSFSCFLMYLRNASLDHLLRSMIVNTGTPSRYIAIAVPLLAE